MKCEMILPATVAFSFPAKNNNIQISVCVQRTLTIKLISQSVNVNGFFFLLDYFLVILYVTGKLSFYAASASIRLTGI